MKGANPTSQEAELLTKEHIVDAARPNSAWLPAAVGQGLLERDLLRTGGLSRASLRLTSLAVLRVNELTTLQILPSRQTTDKPTLDLKGGSVFFFSREKPQQLHLRTPLATGALRGTEFHAQVGANGRTVVTMFEGELELRNAFGSLNIVSGEQATVDPGRPPVKTAVIEATNIIQWCLYYPGVVDVTELGLSPAQQAALSASLTAYRQGDLLNALRLYPHGRLATSEAEHIYRAALLLEVGQVDKAYAELTGLPQRAPKSKALKQLIAAVKFQEYTRVAEPQSATEWMAESYYQQSRSNLKAALQAARKATEASPEFGFAWTRVAELEFSSGRVLKAMKVLERGLELSPRNAQAHALQGFFLSSENRMGGARRCFEEAIALDGALGNAWLGRGLTSIRQGREEDGRRDLQTAAALEPNRSVFRSYLGKAFSQVGNNPKANLELTRAIELDARDPTPWLYSAIQRKQENRYNEAVDDLEKSFALNDNRRVYRSQFLLDQDRSIRGANLAAIYQNNGMTEQSVREAVRAVGNDYGSAPAHLFLANSYDALRDPTRINLRYETAWFNELLLANLLSPVGGGPLSQFVSEQEYSKLFEKDGFGISSTSEYFSYGELRETASQYGTFGNLSYAIDSEYLYNDGLRPNNRISRLDGYGTFKLQLAPQDTIFFQTKFADLETGEVSQYYDPREVERIKVETNGIVTKIPNRPRLTFDFREKQDPAILLLGWHHEWTPGNHTLFLAGKLANEQQLTVKDTSELIVGRDVTTLVPPSFEELAWDHTFVPGQDYFAALRAFAARGQVTNLAARNFDLDYHAKFETYTGELQHILTLGPDTLVIGGRYQRGDFRTRVLLVDNKVADSFSVRIDHPAAHQESVVDFERFSLYAYDTLRVAHWLTVSGGVTYDDLHYPDNFRSPPINDRQAELEKVLPKAGAIIQPWDGATIRGAYAQAISGSSFDESVRLEPVQVAGFLQAFRTAIPESILGPVAGSKYEFFGVSAEQRFASRTYVGLEYQVIRQDVDRTIGVFDELATVDVFLGDVPSSLAEHIHYREDAIIGTVNQLIGNEWSLGARYKYTHSKLRNEVPELMKALEFFPEDILAATSETERSAGLHSLNLYAIYNHRCGFFARGEANWYRQQNDNLSIHVIPLAPDAPVDAHPRMRRDNLGLPGEDFWQFNFFTGYRFWRNQCELSCGILNMTGEDYRLNPLNSYLEMPRDRTLLFRCKLSF